MTASFCEKSLMIIGKTNDGNDLTGQHLKLVEMAINGHLNKDGEEAFEELHRQVSSGEYAKPWLHGVEHMTADHAGYIYWKELNIEHYDYPYESSNVEKLQDLSKRCLHIEQLGVTPNTNTVVWFWPWMEKLTIDHQWLDFFKHDPGLWEGNECLVVVMKKKRVAFFHDGKVDYFEGIDGFLDSWGDEYDSEEIDYHKFASAGFGIPKAGQDDHQGLVYAPLDGVISLLEKHRVPSNLFQPDFSGLQKDTNIG